MFLECIFCEKAKFSNWKRVNQIFEPRITNVLLNKQNSTFYKKNQRSKSFKLKSARTSRNHKKILNSNLQFYIYMAYLFQMITEFVVHLAGFEQPAYFLNM